MTSENNKNNNSYNKYLYKVLMIKNKLNSL